MREEYWEFDGLLDKKSLNLEKESREENHEEIGDKMSRFITA